MLPHMLAENPETFDHEPGGVALPLDAGSLGAMGSLAKMLAGLPMSTAVSYWAVALRVILRLGIPKTAPKMPEKVLVTFTSSWLGWVATCVASTWTLPLVSPSV